MLLFCDISLHDLFWNEIACDKCHTFIWAFVPEKVIFYYVCSGATNKIIIYSVSCSTNKIFYYVGFGTANEIIFSVFWCYK